MNSRSYSMVTRAASAQNTRSAILGAAFDLVGEKSNLEIVLADVADRAGVTVKTILRHFGSRAGLFDAVAEYARREIETERTTPVGDIDRAVKVIVEHYELRGDWVIRMLSQVETDDRIDAAMKHGQAVHREWVSTTFGPQLESSNDPEQTVDLLVVATDVYTWKILRRNRGLSFERTARSMRALVLAVLNLESDRSSQ